MSQKQDRSELQKVTECLDRLEKSVNKLDIEYRGIFEGLYEQNIKLWKQVNSLNGELKKIKDGKGK